MNKLLIIILLMTVVILFSQTPNITYKEVMAAKEFYDSGEIGKAGSVLDMLIRDKDKKLAEQALLLKSELFSDVFNPPDYKSALLPELQRFADKNKKNSTVKNIEKQLNEKSEAFTSKVRSNNNYIAMLFSDSCIVNYAPDSTFYLSFEREFTGIDKMPHKIRIGFSGRLNTYQPYGDMQDEWGSTGLIIKTDGNIFIELDGQPVFVSDNPLSVKQYPEYVLRKVTKYGFTQEQTFIREDDSEALTRLAFMLNDSLLVTDLNLKLQFGKMNDLVPYYSDTKERIFPDKFNSKAYVELRLNHIIE